MNIDCIIENQNHQALRRGNNQISKVCLKKQTDLISSGVCCPRHIHCSPIINKQSSEMECDSISVASQLLKEFTPQEIKTELWYQFQAKPEIEMLAHINIRTKQYEKMIKEYQAEQLQKRKKLNLQKISYEAKMALQNPSKIAQTPSAKWGHSIFTYNQQNEKKKSKQQNEKQKQKQKEREREKEKEKERQLVKRQKKVQLQPINQRIAKYKQEQLRKIKSEQHIDKKIRTEVNIQDTNNQIKQNAQKILFKMKMQKEQKEEQKKIIQAKIRALQIKSLKKVSISKKKPLQQGLQFKLSDSQYSTFSARAQNRKHQKKGKKEKVKKNTQDPSLIETKKSKYSSKQNSSNSKNDRNKQIIQTKEKNKKQQLENKQAILKPENYEELKGPFYIWNIPINQEDAQKLEQKSKDIYMNVDRFNYKSGKTFREEANQFLAKKMEKKMEEKRKEQKQQAFLTQVAKRKEMLDKQFKHEINGIMSEPIWNEDQVFRPNILQNFHFFAKQKAF